MIAAQRTKHGKHRNRAAQLPKHHPIPCVAGLEAAACKNLAPPGAGAAAMASSAAMAGSAGGSVAVLTHHFHRVKKKLLGITIGYDSGRRTDEHQHGYSRMDNDADDVVRNQAPVRLLHTRRGLLERHPLD